MAIKFGSPQQPRGAANFLAAQVQAKLAQAVALHQQGQLTQAQVLYQDILKVQPRHFHALHLLGVIAFQTGNFAKSVDLIGQAIAINPDFADFHSNLGNALQGLRQYDAAVASYNKAIAMNPGDADLYFNCGNALRNLKQLDAALVSYDKAISIKPDHAGAYSNRGLALHGLQQFDAAVASYDKAIFFKPDSAEAHSDRGNALRELKQYAAAVASYDKALTIRSDFVEAHYNCGLAFYDLQQFDSAVASYDNAIAIKPDYAEAHYNRGNVLQDLMQFDAAVASYDRAIAIKPDSADAYFRRGRALHDMNLFNAAVTSYDKAIAINQNDADAYCNRGNVLQRLLQLDAAIASYDKAIAIKPDYAEAYSNRGNVLKDSRQFDAAIACYDKAIAIKPDNFVIYQNRLFCLTRSLGLDARQLYSEHLAFGQQFETLRRADWEVHNNVRDPARCLQIGLVSGDLCSHPVASFLEPVLEFLAKKPYLSLHAYDTHPVKGEVSRRLRTYFAHWHSVAGLSDADLANSIRTDGIDILIDLSGHTAHNRLLCFARKPAPIQVTWIGYPGTTGLQAMDYILGDRFWIPQELAWQFTEKLAYLPAGMIFKPSELSPPVGSLPALTNGYITFGSFNRANKITDAAIALWSSLMRNLPTARISIGATAPDVHAALTQSFINEGVDSSRLTFLPRVSDQDYLALHHQFDMCLDTFPYGGATTTAQAGWMGVPTLTLAGEAPASRYGLTFMGHWGLDTFVATSHEDFVSKGVYWAEHLEELSTLRYQMRSRFNASAMGRPQACADALEATLRTMWQRWCNDLPAATIDATDFESGEPS